MFSKLLPAFALLIVHCGNLFSQQSNPFPLKNHIYKQGWIDFNKNNKKDIYEDPLQPVEKRIDNLLAQMTLEEKSCQLATYYGHGKVLKDSLPTIEWNQLILKDGIANIDEHINNTPRIKENETPFNNATAINETQRFFVEYTRLGIPVDFSNEGIRGLCARHATSFPSMNAVGCTWNKELAFQQGKVEGKEARVLGYTNVYAPILDVVRDQRWGRWEGTFGEDPFLVARMGVAMARGIQSEKVVSTPKHYVGYGDCKGARQWDARTDPHITPSEMYYIHEYPFRKVFREAGALGVMSSYNDYNGVPIASNHFYLTTKLRNEMGFKGYVVSDSYSIERLSDIHNVCSDHKESCLLALQAGLNVRTDFNTPDEYINNIRALVKEGKIPIKRINELVRNVLYVKFWLGLFDNPYTGNPELAQQIVSSKEHQAMALRASRECLVLLKNENNILPLKNNFKKIAVIGPNAHTNNYVPTHYGPMDYTFTSVYDGLKNVYKNVDVEIKYAKGIDLISKGWPENELIPDTLSVNENKSIQEAVDLALQSDVVVVVLGDGTSTSGESRTRSSLDLPGHQEQLLEALVKTKKPVVLVLVWGRPATINFAQKYCKAILGAPYPGAQGGQAIAEALKGDYNPGGKLNGTWVKSVGQLPFNIPAKPNANWEPMKNYSVANKGLLYCFGFGLSYTQFAYDSIAVDSIESKTGNITVRCKITNSGDVAGDEVVQLYINDVISSTTTYEKQLRGFERIHLQPGESKWVQFQIVPEDLELINTDNKIVVEPGEFSIMIGASYDDIRLKKSFYVVGQQAKNQMKTVKASVIPSKMMRDSDAGK
ncbi:glycoside hydrolase family 3 C-terminal domain-containing protein [Chitinophagaceae bacterium LB-8]|uniref:Glycoside hydrolase family 3 C-terminal domain-containing protein n=1 Tax=Paraflavisolibacter caeni TaxID=2982496 RepID=A0A9X2XUV6_9BACT|nr:glycoside hydrolase family 3 N-terminal domain-containing protein [Paraflavisolibacter caeni]MCU7549724.1 glycoside hydrolase family 3 C-terminal domain-containing protein [Paraflavisolibacter caeni]